MSIIPSVFGGRRSNIFDPFSVDIWDPFQDFTFGNALRTPQFSTEAAAFANARIDWKETPEAHVFKADLPGLKKEEVKVEMEEGRVLQISGERNREHEEKNDKWQTAAFANARIDWKETSEVHVFKADLPGLKKEEVKVELEKDRVLQVSGESNREHEEKSDKWHRVERSSGKFLRRFRLPENAKVDQVKATMENGVLTITVPKEETRRPEVKAIEISS
uniref:17.8 kDa class I heat shock protein-like n=1 Tax=Nelumbo nucifera TaxID=4432 RepID=A0A822ZED3_NELNU|nr:TPA_asm: hypothetical protein HUJ06_001090 [Nelumbo nucifera]